MPSIEPTTAIDKSIALAWPKRWQKANDDRPGAAKRRNRLRQQWRLAKMPPFDVVEKLVSFRVRVRDEAYARQVAAAAKHEEHMIAEFKAAGFVWDEELGMWTHPNLDVTISQ